MLEVEVALRKFVSDNEDVALEGFEVLIDFGRQTLDAYLRKEGVNYNKAQDIIQTVLIKVWKNRPRFKNEGSKAFQGFLCLLAHREKIGSIEKEDTLEEEILIKVIPSWENVMEQNRILQEVLLTAGEVWLGYHPKLTKAQRDQRVMAAQFHYLEGCTWQEAMELAKGPQDEKVFETWVCDPAVVLTIFFEALNLSGDDLMRHVLGLPDAEEEELAGIYQASVREPADSIGPSGLRQAEIAAMFWKYRDAEKPQTIKAFARVLFGPKLDDAQLDELFARCDAKLPFLQILEKTMNAFSNEIRPLLKGKGLWKRLVFEFWFFEEVPQKDIVARLAPGAATVDFKIDTSLLTSWIGNGRLLDDLRGGL